MPVLFAALGWNLLRLPFRKTFLVRQTQKMGLFLGTLLNAFLHLKQNNNINLPQSRCQYKNNADHNWA